MGQCKSTKRYVNFSEDESEWEAPATRNSLAGQLTQVDEELRAQRDVMALLESQLSVLARDEELVGTLGLDDEDDQRRRKMRRKRRRQLTFYRSSELLTTP